MYSKVFVFVDSKIRYAVNESFRKLTTTKQRADLIKKFSKAYGLTIETQLVSVEDAIRELLNGVMGVVLVNGEVVKDEVLKLVNLTSMSLKDANALVDYASKVGVIEQRERELIERLAEMSALAAEYHVPIELTVLDHLFSFNGGGLEVEKVWDTSDSWSSSSDTCW